MQGYRWLLLLLLVCAPLAMGEGIYKWVDEKGQVHYGEAAPEGSQSSEVAVKTTPPSAGVPQQDHKENTQRLLRTFEEERAQKQEAEAKEAEETADRKRKCNIARDRLRSFKEAGAIYSLDKNGERRIYNDAEHAATLKRAEQDVASYCK